MRKIIFLLMLILVFVSLLLFADIQDIYDPFNGARLIISDISLLAVSDTTPELITLHWGWANDDPSTVQMIITYYGYDSVAAPTRIYIKFKDTNTAKKDLVVIDMRGPLWGFFKKWAAIHVDFDFLKAIADGKATICKIIFNEDRSKGFLIGRFNAAAVEYAKDFYEYLVDMGIIKVSNKKEM